jgi:hypothetical protein
MVFVDKATEAIAARDRPSGFHETDWRSALGYSEVETTVGSLLVVVIYVGLQHGLEVPFAEHKDPVETLGPDEALGIGICSRSSPRSANDLDTLRFEHFVERLSESMVSSRTRNRNGVDRDSRASDRLRAIWVHHLTLVAPSVTPPIRTLRVWRSIKNRTCRVFRRIVSTVNRSQATIDAAWVRMNLLQVSRFGPGRRFDAMTRRMLDAEISMPTLSSSP